MFINFSNHPSKNWTKEQLDAAAKYGEVIDVAFPTVDPKASGAEVESTAREWAEKIAEMLGKNTGAVMVQGEFTCAYHVIMYLKSLGIRVVAATSCRIAEERVDSKGNSVKNVVFKFEQFREY